jgi:hypothetical protein
MTIREPGEVVFGPKNLQELRLQTALGFIMVIDFFDTRKDPKKKKY